MVPCKAGRRCRHGQRCRRYSFPNCFSWGSGEEGWVEGGWKQGTWASRGAEEVRGRWKSLEG